MGFLRESLDLSQGEVRKSDFALYLFLRVLALFVIFVFFSIFYALYKQSKPVIAAQGFSFLIQTVWDPERGHFGVLPFIYGTAITSAIALAIAVPISIASGLFLSEVSSHWMRVVLGFLLEMLAAIPSVVFGLWGIFVMVPLIRDYLQPAIESVFGFIPFFHGPRHGVGIFSAGLILSFMILPTIISVCREVFQAIPNTIREAALGLGATRWEMIRLSVLRSSIPGIFGATVLGLGRAIGETMAVAMLVGNRAEIANSIFAPGATMASVIANEYAEASSDLHLSALSAVGFALLLASFIVNLGAQIIVARARRFGN